MVIGKELNRLLSNLAYMCRERHLPDVADVLKQAAVLAGLEHLKDVSAELEAINKEVEAKLVAGEDVTPDDLPNIPPPAAEDPNETFTPLPDAEEVHIVAEPETAAETSEDDELLADLDEQVS